MLWILCKINKWLDGGIDQDHYADCPIENLAITQQIMSGFLTNCSVG